METNDRVRREQKLRSAVLAGDELAWQTWYDESFERLYHYVAVRSGADRDRIEEVVQESWLTAVRRVSTFDPEQGSFADWLCGIAINVLRNQQRKQVVRNRNISPLVEGVTEASQPNENVQQDRAKRIGRVLEALPQHYQAVLQAKYLEGHTVGRIAADWDQSPKTIESLLTRAREAFRQVYGSILEPEHE